MGTGRFDSSSLVFTVALVALVNALFYVGFVGDDEDPSLSFRVRSLATKKLAAHLLANPPKLNSKTQINAGAKSPQSSTHGSDKPLGEAGPVSVLWTERSLSDATLSLPASVISSSDASGPSGKGKDLSTIKVLLDGDDEFREVAASRIAGESTPQILVKDILADYNDELESGDIVKMTIAALRPKNLAKEARKSSHKPPVGSLSLRLASLADLRERSSLTIRVVPGVWEQHPLASSWLALPAVTKNDEAMSIHLKNAQDLAQFLPMIRGAKALSIEADGKRENYLDGYCFVRGREVAAVVWGGSVTSEQWSRIANALHASMIYRGPAAAFLMAPHHEVNFADKLTAVSKVMKGPIFVYDSRPGDGRYPILPATILNEPQIATYLQDATALFTRPVQLLAPSVALAH